jgi:hypothetical protein
MLDLKKTKMFDPQGSLLQAWPTEFAPTAGYVSKHSCKKAPE